MTNFDEIIPRRGSNSYKWDSEPDPEVLPLWVADMDFRVAPPIAEALERRVKHGIFGYTKVPDAYYDAVTDWFRRRHAWSIRNEWIIYTSGVVPAVSAVIKALANPGDQVIVQTPVYNCFFSSIRNNGCEIVRNPLVRHGLSYRIDFEDLERKASSDKAKILLLCNPHNPAGRVWTPVELARVGDICLRHNVTVVSDEIHCELVFPGASYTPFASLSGDFLEHSVSCISPTKAFNMAGLQIANIVAAREDTRKKIDKAININEVCDVNPFGVEALIAAYNHGEEWLSELLDYLLGNYQSMRSFCAEHLPAFPVFDLEGTYLAWMDTSALNTPSEALEEQLVREAKLWLNAGCMYGPEGEGFMRWNLACPRSRLMEAMERFRSFAASRGLAR